MVQYPRPRLVIEGFHGVNFFKAFSSIVKLCTVRVVLNLVLMHKCRIRQLDTNKSFLNGMLSRDVYM